MNSNRYFFICSCVILSFSLLNYSLGPAINKKVFWDWSYNNCGKINDDFMDAQKGSSLSLETYKDYLFRISECKTKVAMYNMEYASFIFNVIVGFVCVLISIYGFQEKPIPKSNFIGMGCGLLGFVLTFIYIILNGIVYTNYYEGKYSTVNKMESDGSVLEYEENKGFKCLFYSDIGNKKSFIAKYSDYVKSQYNYDKDLIDSYEKDEAKKNCSIPRVVEYNYRYYTIDYNVDTCSKKEYLTYDGYFELIAEYCKKLYLKPDVLSDNYKKYNLGVRFLVVLMFSIFMLPCYCALVFFAFKLSSDASDYKPVKN